jgi:SAM-dependent methyltransferase
MIPTDTIDDLRADLELVDADVAVLELASADPSEAEALIDAGRDRPTLGVLPAGVDDRALARLRDACWPEVHFMTVFRVAADGAVTWSRSGNSGTSEVRSDAGPLTILHTATHDDALGPSNTVIKFDLRASAWNGAPGSPTYGHYRWMRRLVAEVARPQLGQHTLDAGCGTGWVGIEAGLQGAMVSAFDPSAEMVKLAQSNAEQVGIDLDAKVGFVEDVPFDRAFDVVLNSGVISFAPDPQIYLDRLDALVEPGGVLVIGDINPESRGFSRRRARSPLLPARELNGLSRPRVVELLGARGYTVESRRYYQLSFPVPELMALSEKKIGGVGCGMMLALNKVATGTDHATGSHMRRQFDSWILRARKAGPSP